MRSLLAFCSGLAAYKGYDIYKQYFAPHPSQPKADYHAFEKDMHELNFKQPRVIQMQYKSEQMHFLHNFIIQNENSALNFIKVYFPDNLEQNILNGTVAKMSDEEIKEKIKVHVLFNANQRVQGHHGIVHGGLIATLIDNAFGYLSVAAFSLTPSATAYLNISYKKPLKIEEDYMISCEIEKIEGRKIFLKAQILDVDGKVYTEAQSLFVKVNWGVDQLGFMNLIKKEGDKLKEATEKQKV